MVLQHQKLGEILASGSEERVLEASLRVQRSNFGQRMAGGSCSRWEVTGLDLLKEFSKH